MKLEGRLFTSNKLLTVKEVELVSDPGAPFSRNLENALILLCRELDIPVPAWMKKNTREFAAFYQTVFLSEQYQEQVNFDRFVIRMTE